MPLDFQQLKQQIKKFADTAPTREKQLNSMRDRAAELLRIYAERGDLLRAQIDLACSKIPNLRCAVPRSKPITERKPLPAMPERVEIIAVDGSQINPDRQRELDYYLINMGGILLSIGSHKAPIIFTDSRLFYAQSLYTDHGKISEGLVSLQRDLLERKFLIDLVQKNLSEKHSSKIISLTDGPLALWDPRDDRGKAFTSYRKSVEEYNQTLIFSMDHAITTAGYVDKPRADLVVRMLEIAEMKTTQPDELWQQRNLHGVTDIDLFATILGVGERSTVFGIQSRSIKDYHPSVAFHFFYLNVGSASRPWLVRVEIPAWVAEQDQKLDDLHAVLIQQCQIMGQLSYPYLLHRAHEIAVVSKDEHDQLTQMLAIEMRRQGSMVGEKSRKQAAKDLPGRRKLR